MARQSLKQIMIQLEDTLDKLKKHMENLRHVNKPLEKKSWTVAKIKLEGRIKWYKTLLNGFGKEAKVFEVTGKYWEWINKETMVEKSFRLYYSDITPEDIEALVKLEVKDIKPGTINIQQLELGKLKTY